jgi:hypothetical protein
MKNILKGGLGATVILVLVYLFSVQVSSCNGRDAKIPDAKGFQQQFPIRIPHDSSAWSGSGTGFVPKALIVICTTKNCLVTSLPDSTSIPPGNPAMEMLFTTQDAIPAHSVIHLQVFQSPDSSGSLQDKKAK